jgi:hypothetical protein
MINILNKEKKIKLLITIELIFPFWCRRLIITNKLIVM